MDSEQALIAESQANSIVFFEMNANPFKFIIETTWSQVSEEFAAMEVVIISREHVKPSSPTPAHLRTYRLSLLDQFVPTAAHTPMILFYDAPTAFSTDEALRRLKQSASQALPEFYLFAGKIKDDLYIDCNDDGIYYAEAKVDCSLSDVLARPNAKVIGKLLPDEPSLLESTSSDGDGIQVVMVQVNVFECGGIALGAYLSHKIIDGPTCVTLLKAWSATVRGSAGEVTPSFIAPSLFPQSESIPSDCMLKIWLALLKLGTCVTKRFVFDATATAAIKSAEAHLSLVAHPTRIEAISAFIWGRCIAATEARRDGARRPSVLSHMINLRSKNKSLAALPEHMSALRESLLKLNVKFFAGDWPARRRHLGSASARRR
ncbi:hypothetical protein NL676_027479 [Syzygium grande]|nr:hypothetical protein NL676_027479 [Syzygium grande]